MYLQEQGYKLVKKSAGSMEFHKDPDKIVLNMSRETISYFNRNDSMDKGLFFKYILRREDNFYSAIKRGLAISHQSFDDSQINLEIKPTKKISRSLESNYNITPLRSMDYLTKIRGISKDTLLDPKFKDRIFNAFHVRDNGGKIPNTAFPKYDLEGTIKNYVLYNRPYKSTIDQEIKKFRLVLNKKDHFLFYSKPDDDKRIRVVIGESVPDILAYHELHGEPDNFYISSEGNLYPEKLEFFTALFQRVTQGKKVEVLSIMDNDPKGFEFDMKVFCALINAHGSEVYVDSRLQNGNVSLNFHYEKNSKNNIAAHLKQLKKTLVKMTNIEVKDNKLIKCLGFSDKLVIEFNLKDITKPLEPNKNNSVFEGLWNQINSIYLSFPTGIKKSISKDWNEELLLSKQPKLLEMAFTNKNCLAVGDLISLKSVKGPEGTMKRGLVLKVEEHSALCDFGLTYKYAIPYTNIRRVYKKESLATNYKGSYTLKKLQKKNNLQNNIL